VRVRFDRVAGRHVVVPSADSAPREELLDTPPRLRDSRHWNGMQTALLLRRIDRVLDKAVAMTNGGLTGPADRSLGSTSAPAQTAFHLVQSVAPRPTSATLPAGLLCLDVKALPKVPKQNQSSVSSAPLPPTAPTPVSQRATTHRAGSSPARQPQQSAIMSGARRHHDVSWDDVDRSHTSVAVATADEGGDAVVDGDDEWDAALRLAVASQSPFRAASIATAAPTVATQRNVEIRALSGAATDKDPTERTRQPTPRSTSNAAVRIASDGLAGTQKTAAAAMANHLLKRGRVTVNSGHRTIPGSNEPAAVTPGPGEYHTGLPKPRPSYLR
jgi:hypothetical protein